MRNYLAAECFKMFRRKYFYVTMAIFLALEGILLWGIGGPIPGAIRRSPFTLTSMIVALLLSFGHVLPPLETGDMVFSDQYKHTTLKNEVSYGIPRVRIYLGKLLVSLLVAFVACAVLVGFYLAGCWLLFPHSGEDGQALAIVGYCLAGALPLWDGSPGGSPGLLLPCAQLRDGSLPGGRDPGGPAQCVSGLWYPVPPHL